jgi:hypothetical protein
MQLFLICLFLVCSTCFGLLFRPSSGAYNSIYGFRYCPPMLLLAGIVDEMEISSTIPAISNIVGQYLKL